MVTALKKFGRSKEQAFMECLLLDRKVEELIRMASDCGLEYPDDVLDGLAMQSEELLGGTPYKIEEYKAWRQSLAEGLRI